MFWKWLSEKHPNIYDAVQWCILLIALLALLHS